MSPPRVVFLDLGNVLVFHDNARLFRSLGERAGLEGAEVQRRLLREGWTAANRGELGSEALRAHVSEALGAPLSREAFFELWNCHFTVHDAVLPRVERLLSQARVGVISNTNAVHVEYLRPRLPILERLEPVLFSCEVGQVKPEPAIFEEALRRAGCPASEAIFFDDLPEYVEASERAGIRGRLFTTAEQFDAQLGALGL